jgi:hypothetical protein
VNIPLHNDSSSGRSRNGEHEVLDFDNTDIPFAANLYGGSRVELILEIRSTCHDLGPSLTDYSRADRDVQGIFDEVDAVREVSGVDIFGQSSSQASMEQGRRRRREKLRVGG